MTLYFSSLFFSPEYIGMHRHTSSDNIGLCSNKLCGMHNRGCGQINYQKKNENGGALGRCSSTSETEKGVDIGTETVEGISKLVIPAMKYGSAGALFRICWQMEQCAWSWVESLHPCSVGEETTGRDILSDPQCI
jgi:hypothetical protein